MEWEFDLTARLSGTDRTLLERLPVFSDVDVLDGVCDVAQFGVQFGSDSNFISFRTISPNISFACMVSSPQ